MNMNFQENSKPKRHFSEFVLKNALKKAYLNLGENFKMENLQMIEKDLNNQKLKLKSNSLFAFQNDAIYSKLCNDIDENNSFNQISQISDYAANSSNFLANITEKSPRNNFFLINSNYINEVESNSCSISSEIEKNLETLLDEFNSTDDLNEAKIDLTQNEQIENVKDEKFNILKLNSVTSITSEINFKNIFEKKGNDNESFESPCLNLQDNKINDEKLFQEKEESNKFVIIKHNSNSSNEKSEKYDEMVDISPNVHEKIETKAKRVSAENGSLITQTSLNSLVKKSKLMKPNEDKSNSFEWSCSKSVCSNLSRSHGQNTSEHKHRNKNSNKYGYTKRPSGSTIPNTNNILNNENQLEFHLRSGERNFHLNASGQFYHPSKFSSSFLSRFCNSTNNSYDNSNDFLINLNRHNQRLPSNPGMLDYDIDKVFSDAFTLNMDVGNNFGSKRSTSNVVNDENKILNDSNKNRQIGDSNNNLIINPTNINKSFNINTNDTSYHIPTMSNNTNSKTNGSIYNLTKNTNTLTTFYFNINNYQYYKDDKKLLDNIHKLLLEQAGCRFVQLKIEEKNKNQDRVFLSKFFEKIKENLINIINDQFGNYVVQKFFEGIILDFPLLARFFQIIRADLFTISIHPFGTRFFQKSLENLSSIYEQNQNLPVNEIFKELIINHCYDLIIDTNGNHVFQKILIMYPKDKNQFIYDELNKISLEVAKIKQGGCIFQRAFDIASLHQKKFLISEILKNIHLLINDEYGNFIVQSVIYLKIADVNDIIFNFLKDKLLDLSKKKFSSNVIDKCILMEDPYSNNKMRYSIINTIIENKWIGELICDVYGNYVIQKSLYVSEGVKFMEIIDQIKSASKILRQTPHGKKIYENLINLYGGYFYNNFTKMKTYPSNNQGPFKKSIF